VTAVTCASVPQSGFAYDRSVSSFAERLQSVEERIAAACHRAGRSREDLRLMGVSKMHSAETIAEAARAGLTLFGENRVQEFEAKRHRLQELYITDAEVHLIGHLQSNKSARAAGIFSAIDSVDSWRLAERLNDAAGKLGRKLPVLLEIKLSAEPAKTGIDPDSAELRPLLERLPSLEHLAMRGLMTIAPFDDNPETARACFRRLRTLRDTLARENPHIDFRELSMGMSGDFEIAIEEGSTLVRIGTALFGERLATG
jgi:PLP dependent protein